MTKNNPVEDAVKSEDICTLIQVAESLKANVFTRELNKVLLDNGGNIKSQCHSDQLNLRPLIDKMDPAEVFFVRIIPVIKNGVTLFTADFYLTGGCLTLETTYSIRTPQMTINFFKNLFSPLGFVGFTKDVIFNGERIFCNRLGHTVGPFNDSLQTLHKWVQENNPNELDWGGLTVKEVMKATGKSHR